MRILSETARPRTSSYYDQGAKIDLTLVLLHFIQNYKGKNWKPTKTHKASSIDILPVASIDPGVKIGPAQGSLDFTLENLNVNFTKTTRPDFFACRYI